MTRLLAILVIFLATFTPETSVPTFASPKTETSLAVRPSDPESRDPRQQAALALIDFPWQELGYGIIFLSARPGYRAMTLSRAKTIEIYARPGDDAQMLAYDIAHELGHAIDLSYNTSATRAQWKKARGIDPATPWFGCNKCSDYNTPAGDFAETFSFLLLGPSQFRGRIAPHPTPEQIPFLMQFFPMIRVENHADAS